MDPESPSPPATGAALLKRYRWPVLAVMLVAVLVKLVPAAMTAWRTVSTDDAYVNGHVTFVAPRVAGQVVRVLVDDNNRVHKGDLVVQLDREPFQVRVNIARAAVEAAQANLVVTRAHTRGVIGQARSTRFGLEHAIELVDDQLALLRSKVATLRSQEATVEKAQADYDRGLRLITSGAVSKEDLDRRKEAITVAKNRVVEARQGVYQIRVGLGLPAEPPDGGDLDAVPPNFDQQVSSVREAQARLIKVVAELGVAPRSFDLTPRQMITEFYARDPEGNIDRIYQKIVEDAPAIKEADSALAQAERNLDQAELDLRYCDVVAEIDGVVTRREVNPGNNVVAGQSLMAIRSLTDIWVDANFKETQLAELRIGLPVDIEADMYGSRERFKGRVSGVTMGTGSTLALLPAENATGNFVKVVQRIPVRIDLEDYDPDKVPLFIGVSVTPRVWVREKPTGPNAGKILQPYQEPAVAEVPNTRP
jgi:membrane fusion protein, multidrug efflux system